MRDVDSKDETGLRLVDVVDCVAGPRKIGDLEVP
jgi:hypothetical protein